MSLLFAVLVGLALSVVIERWLAPRPPTWARPKGAWGLHIGIWGLVYTAFIMVVQRPWFAMFLVSAFLLLIVVISNAKFKSLAEPFTFQDFRYFKDAIRYPRLYLPFLGLGKALVAFLGVLLAVCVGFFAEPSASDIFYDISTNVVVLIIGSGLLLWLGNRQLLEPTYDPTDDLTRFGLLASLWAYVRGLRNYPAVDHPLKIDPENRVLVRRPHLVAVQSESFFDPRDLLTMIKPDVLANFDAAKLKARSYGSLLVPALGANTVRSEFGFLTGLDDSILGAHKFNPYELVLKGWQVEALPKIMKHLGYRTVCIHPYAAGFYSRDRVLPLLGFDEFIDLSAFEGAERCGNYVSDAALTDQVIDLLARADVPTFVFVITMENHGPLHLEKLAPVDLDTLYHSPSPLGVENLTAYLRHLKNADLMFARLTAAFDQMTDPISLCWYGDHVPIMPDVYDRFQHWPRDSEYLVWDNQNLYQSIKIGSSQAMPVSTPIHKLVNAWLAQ